MMPFLFALQHNKELWFHFSRCIVIQFLADAEWIILLEFVYTSILIALRCQPIMYSAIYLDNALWLILCTSFDHKYSDHFHKKSHTRWQNASIIIIRVLISLFFPLFVLKQTNYTSTICTILVHLLMNYFLCAKKEQTLNKNG